MHIKNAAIGDGGTNGIYDTPEKKFAILGASDADLPYYAARAKANNLILISDASTSDEFIDKSAYGHVFRLSFTESYRYSAIANFLKSREWKVVNIIHGEAGVPTSLTAKLNLFGVRYSSTMFPAGFNGGTWPWTLL